MLLQWRARGAVQWNGLTAPAVVRCRHFELEAMITTISLLHQVAWVLSATFLVTPAGRPVTDDSPVEKIDAEEDVLSIIEVEFVRLDHDLSHGVGRGAQNNNCNT